MAKLNLLNALEDSLTRTKQYIDAELAKKANSSHGDHVTWSTTTPKANGTAAVGSETKVARGDHVHPLQTSVSGNAGTATKLANARTITIGNKANTFDGTGNISYTLSDIGAAPASHGTHLTLGTGSGNAFRGDYGNTAYTHSQAAHAPSNAQKNSDITKAEIEAKLTGAITSHTHSYLPLSGGTMTGDIKFTDVTSTTYPAKSAMLTWNGSTDGADIYYQVDASDKGRLVLNTRDDADCIIAFANKGTIISTIDNSGNFSGKAATATSLQTARTINGTSFNGTTNITTANWGTARNLTIGNTAKSVNGSGNVSWSLSEIGAQSSNRSINFQADHTSNWTSSSAMGGLTYAGGWHGAVGSDAYLSFGNSGGNIIHMFIDGEYYAKENKKVYHEGNKPVADDIMIEDTEITTMLTNIFGS